MQGMTRSGEQPGPKFLFRWVSCHQGLHWKRRKLFQVRKPHCSSCRIQSGGHHEQGNQFQSIWEHNPRDQFELDEEKFFQNLRSVHCRTSEDFVGTCVMAICSF